MIENSNSFSNIHITPYYKPAWIYGGPIQSIAYLVDSQQFLTGSTKIFTTTANGNKELLYNEKEHQEVDGARVYYFPRRGLKSAFLAPGLLWKLFLSLQKGNIIHIHTWWNLTAILSIAICHFKGIRPVFSPRGMLSPYSFQSGRSIGKKLFQAIIGKRLLRNTILHATSELELKECQNIIPNWPHFVLPNILDLPKNLLERSKTGATPLNLMFLSRIHPKKGLELLFEALSTNNGSWVLNIAGDGEEAYIEKLKELATQFGIASKIHWLGWVDGAAKFELLAQQDLLVLTSYNENFANVIIESLAVGTPVLVSNQVGLWEYVQQNNLGWVSALDAQAIAATIVKAQADQQHRAWICNNAPEIIQRDFSPLHIAQQYLDAYQKFA